MVKKQYFSREIAFKTVKLCLHGEPLQQVLNEELSRHGITREIRAFVTNLCYNFFRFKGRNDFLIRYFYKGRSGLPDDLNLIFGLALTELFYFSRVPAYATLNSYVELTRKFGWKRWVKVVNAILRRVDREFADSLQDLDQFLQNKTREHEDYLAAWYAVPRWLVDLWLENYGQEQCQKYLQASLKQPPLGIRLNKVLTGGLSIEQREQLAALVESGWCDELRDLEREGLLSRQSLAVQEIMDVLKARQWPEPVLDLCAGRGGKTTYLIELGKQVWASDREPAKVRGLQLELMRLRLRSIPLFIADGTSLVLRRRPGAILLDVPCSGLGVLARRPDLKWKQNKEQISFLVSLQASLLEQAWELLSEGGELIYVTCTLNPAENEDQIDNFVHKAGQREVVQVWQTASDSNYFEFFFGAKLKKG